MFDATKESNMNPQDNKNAQVKLALRLRELWDNHKVELPKAGGWNWGHTLKPGAVEEFVQTAELLSQLVLSLDSHEKS